MNEIMSVPLEHQVVSPSNLHINKLVLLLPLVILIGKSLDGFTKKNNDLFSLGSDFITSIDYEDLGEKIDLIKKIGPYLPGNYIEPLNTIIPMAEKAIKVIGLLDFIATNKSYQPIRSVGDLSSKERINGILSAIKDEVSDDKMKSAGPAIELILNFDKYKDLVNMFSSLSSITNQVEKKSPPVEKLEKLVESNVGNKNQLESIVDLIKPILGDNQNISTDKLGDMLKMLQMLNMSSASEGKN